MDYILQNKEFYMDFISPETVEQYTANKRQDGVWGDSLEMCVFAQIFQIELLIYFYDDFPSNVLKPMTPDNNELKQWRDIIYQKSILLDSSIEQYLLEFENNRLQSQQKISFSLLYKNGNHYDALYSMSHQEYLQVMSAYLQNVSVSKTRDRKIENRRARGS